MAHPLRCAHTLLLEGGSSEQQPCLLLLGRSRVRTGTWCRRWWRDSSAMQIALYGKTGFDCLLYHLQAQQQQQQKGSKIPAQLREAAAAALARAAPPAPPSAADDDMEVDDVHASRRHSRHAPAAAPAPPPARQLPQQITLKSAAPPAPAVRGPPALRAPVRRGGAPPPASLVPNLPRPSKVHDPLQHHCQSRRFLPTYTCFPLDFVCRGQWGPSAAANAVVAAAFVCALLLFNVCVSLPAGRVQHRRV